MVEAAHYTIVDVSKGLTHLMGQKRPQHFRHQPKDTSVFNDDVPGSFVEDHLVEDIDDLTHKLVVLLLGCDGNKMNKDSFGLRHGSSFLLNKTLMTAHISMRQTFHFKHLARIINILTTEPSYLLH